MGDIPTFLLFKINFMESQLDTKKIIEAFKVLAQEKNIDKENLSSIIEEIFNALLMKKYGEDHIDNFSVIINMDKGEVEIYQEMVIVDDVDDPVTEIDIKEYQNFTELYPWFTIPAAIVSIIYMLFSRILLHKFY